MINFAQNLRKTNKNALYVADIYFQETTFNLFYFNHVGWMKHDTMFESWVNIHPESTNMRQLYSVKNLSWKNIYPENMIQIYSEWSKLWVNIAKINKFIKNDTFMLWVV